MPDWITRIVVEVGGQRMVYARYSKACKAGRHDLCDDGGYRCTCECDHGEESHV